MPVRTSLAVSLICALFFSTGCERNTPQKASAAMSKPAAPAGPPLPLDDGELIRFTFDGNADGMVAGHLTVTTPESGVEFIDGVIGKAIRFDGTGAEIQVEKAGTLPIADQLTLEFWLRYDGENPVRKSATYTCAAHSSAFNIAVTPHRGTMSAKLTTAEGKVKLQGAEGEIQIGKWSHVALVYDGSRARIYINGEVTAATRASGPIEMKPRLNFGIGTWTKTNQALFGAIDELHLWNRALSDEEISQHATR